MKLLVMPSSIDEIKNTLNYCDAYLIGINNLSVNNNLSIDINDLYEICSIIGDKDLFINLNKNMSNSDIDYLKEVMNKLNDYNIKGVFYYDVGVLNIYNNGNYNYDLVWASEHATTNYNTINYWYNYNVKYTLISSDITLNEIIDISKNSKCKLIVPAFGYQSMFNSKRHIVKNYLDFFELNSDSNIFYMEKEGNKYPIIDNCEGTEVYTNYILNVIEEISNINIEYGLINGFNIDNSIDILKLIKNKDYKQINEIISNTSSGFLYKETIAKVKKSE